MGGTVCTSTVQLVRLFPVSLTFVFKIKAFNWTESSVQPVFGQLNRRSATIKSEGTDWEEYCHYHSAAAASLCILQVHTHTHTRTHTPTGDSPGMSSSQAVLELPIGKGSLLELRDEALEVRPGRQREKRNCDNNYVSTASKHPTNSLGQSQRAAKCT